MLLRQPLIVILAGDAGTHFIPVRGAGDPLFAACGDRAAERTLREKLEQNAQAAFVVLAHEAVPLLRYDVLPKLGFMDRHALAKRRLQEAFPRAACGVYRLRTPTRVLLAAMAQEAAATRWLKPESLSEATVGLTSLAMARLVARLVPSASQEWLIALLPLRCGGISLLALNRGELWSARTLALNIEDTGGLVREVEASLAFLARHGLAERKEARLFGLMAKTDSAGLTASFTAALGGVDFMTPHEAAARLGLSTMVPEDGCADELLARWVGKHGVGLPLLPRERDGRRAHMLIARWGWRGAVAAMVVVMLVLIGACFQWERAQYHAGQLEDALAQARQAALGDGSIMVPNGLTAVQMRAARERQQLFAPPERRLSSDRMRLAAVLAGQASARAWTWRDDGAQHVTLRLKEGGALSPEAAEALRADIARALPEADVQSIALRTATDEASASVEFSIKRRP